jgi:hypothetical protein
MVWDYTVWDSKVSPRDRPDTQKQNPEEELINGPLHRCRCWEISRAGLMRRGREDGDGDGSGREAGPGVHTDPESGVRVEKSGLLLRLGVEQKHLERASSWDG